MAQSLETLRGLAKTPIFGRRLGLDSNDYLVSIPGRREPIEDLTTSTGTVLAHGVSRIITTGSSQGPVQYLLPAPVVGLRKIIALVSTSTGSHQFLSTANGASIKAASDGTTKSVLNFIGQGGVATLMGLTTDTWVVLNQALSGCTGSTGQAASQNITYTTST